METCLIRTKDNTLIVSISGKWKFEVPNCSDEFFRKVDSLRYDYDKIKKLIKNQNKNEEK